MAKHVERQGKRVELFVNGEKADPVDKVKALESMSRKKLDALIQKKRLESRGRDDEEVQGDR